MEAEWGLTEALNSKHNLLMIQSLNKYLFGSLL